MQSASVGFHCPECVNAASQRVIRGPAAFGLIDPILTKILIGINVAIFLADLVIGAGAQQLGPDGGWGCRLPSRGLHEAGILFGCSVDDGEWWRLVTSGFLHSNIMHLGFNMLLLWMLGKQLEPSLGRARYLILYVGSLLAGSLGVMLLGPGQPTLGASGAVFGLMAGFAMQARAANRSIWDSGVGGLILVNVLFTFAVPNISIGGHLGGLVGGLLIGGIFYELGRRLDNKLKPALIGAAVVLSLVFFVAGIALSSTWTDPIFG